MNNDVAVKTSFSLSPSSLKEALELADLMAKSDLVPRDYQGKPGNVLIAVQMGAEVGLSPMQAIQSIAVINGRPTLWGDGLLAVVQSHPDYEWHDESGSDETRGVCIIKRKGHQPHTSIFTREDAKRAGLIGKAGPWTLYEKRMMMFRARGFAMRDKFADAIKGMIMAEEAIDITPTEGPTETGQPAPPPLTLKEKLKAQVIEPPERSDRPEPPSAPPPGSPPAESGTGGPPKPLPTHLDEPSDLDTLKADYHIRLDQAANFKEAAAIREEVLNSDLPQSWKDAFIINFKVKFAEKKK